MSARSPNSSATSSRQRARSPSCAPCSRTPRSITARSRRRSASFGDTDELVRNFLLVVVEKGRASELASIYEEFAALVAADEEARGRAYHGLRALGRRGARHPPADRESVRKKVTRRGAST